MVTLDIDEDPNSDQHFRFDVSDSGLKTLADKWGRIDTIFHLAAAHRDDVRPLSRYQEVNVDGAANICALAESVGANRIVFTSSVAVYGFAPPDTGIDGTIAPFNEYGRTKALAEEIFVRWWKQDPQRRTLVIVRPTVVFGAGNRGNVYNLIKQISSGIFVMIGDGKNKKSMAYVENIADFLAYVSAEGPGCRIYNYVDKPDYDMNMLVGDIREAVGKSRTGFVRVPRSIGGIMGRLADVVARLTGWSLPFSAIRVEKFCATTQFQQNATSTGFVPKHRLSDALKATVRSEFGMRRDGGLTVQDSLGKS
jgi:GlcNAc-P-P-Und epimerase